MFGDVLLLPDNMLNQHVRQQFGTNLRKHVDRHELCVPVKLDPKVSAISSTAFLLDCDCERQDYSGQSAV